MERWEQLELEYAERLRTSSREERKALYAEAYSVVSEQAIKSLPDDPGKRTAGTSRTLVRALIRRCQKNETVLEIGCGRGYTCLGLAPYVKEIVGVDVSEPVLEEARELLKKNHITNAKIQKISGDGLTENLETEFFDKVISIDVYEHLHPDDAEGHLRDVYELLKPGGKYIIVTPNQLTGPHDFTRRVFPDAKKALGFHLNETSATELVEKMKMAGFSKFQIVLPFIIKFPIVDRINYPISLQYWLEQKYLRTKRPVFVKRAIGLFLGIRLIAKKPS